MAPGGDSQRPLEVFGWRPMRQPLKLPPGPGRPGGPFRLCQAIGKRLECMPGQGARPANPEAPRAGPGTPPNRPMPITILQIIILGIVQGAAELLPVSSSAHVIVAEKLMGIDPTSPEATFLLVMLHTGTMFAVLAYFWGAWKRSYFSTREQFVSVAARAVLATALTGAVGLGLKRVIERTFLAGTPSGQIEELFGRLPLIAGALAAAGVLIIIAGRKGGAGAAEAPVTARSAAWMGIVQGLSLPFRGFSRSGGTISTALLLGAGRRQAEEFSFVLAVIITPPVIARELLRLRHAGTGQHHLLRLAAPGLAGMLCSLAAGLLALRLLSKWLEQGRWRLFGCYCLGAAAVVAALSASGI